MSPRRKSRWPSIATRRTPHEASSNATPRQTARYPYRTNTMLSRHRRRHVAPIAAVRAITASLAAVHIRTTSFVVFLLAVSVSLAATPLLPSRAHAQGGTDATLERRVEELLAKLSADEKVAMLGGVNFFDVPGNVGRDGRLAQAD